MTTQKKKKSAKEKRVLIGSVVVATAIVAGSTFAWFSSKDEVTNRLTASADYNVSIVEDFQPPKDWIPGQTVNKDVSAVNTGNVDAFVRMWLGGKMRILKETAGQSIVNSSGSGNSMTYETVTTATDGLTAVTDEKKIKLGLTYQKTDTTTSGSTTTETITYYKTLSKDKIANPNDVNHPGAETSDPTGTNDNQSAGFSEVQSMQAAGVLVYAPAGAEYSWNLEQAADMKVEISGSNPTTTEMNLPKGTKVHSPGTTTIPSGEYKLTATSGGNYYGSIDASTFEPASTGLYLFRRNIGETVDGTANKYEYSGYYYDKEEDVYFALKTQDGANAHSDYVVAASDVDDNSSAAPTEDQVLPVTPTAVKLYTAQETVMQTDDLKWTYDSANTKFTVTNNKTENVDPAISIDIQLANVGAATNDSSENWTAMTDSTNPQKTTFYYNNDVEAGDTTAKLVDSVTLSDETKNGAYLALDFDLDVYLDSVQVTMDEAGIEGGATIETWAATGINDDATFTHHITPASGTVTNSGSEISKIAWS